MKTRSPILDALNFESYQWLALQAPELIDAIESEVAAGRTPEQIQRIVSGHVGAEREALSMARTILTKSPTAIRMLKFAFNAVDDGLVGQQLFAGEATRLAYGTDEAAEGRDSFLEKRDPDWSDVPWHY